MDNLKLIIWFCVLVVINCDNRSGCDDNEECSIDVVDSDDEDGSEVESIRSSESDEENKSHNGSNDCEEDCYEDYSDDDNSDNDWNSGSGGDIEKEHSGDEEHSEDLRHGRNSAHHVEAYEGRNSSHHAGALEGRNSSHHDEAHEGRNNGHHVGAHEVRDSGHRVGAHEGRNIGHHVGWHDGNSRHHNETHGRNNSNRRVGGHGENSGHSWKQSNGFVKGHGNDGGHGVNEGHSVNRRRLRDGYDAKGKVVCYYESLSVYRPGSGLFKISDINPNLCTHLIYAYAGVSKDGVLRSLDEKLDIDNGGYLNFTNLKRQDHSLKAMLAVGGSIEESATFSKIAKTERSRIRFADSALNFLIKYKFDGLDLDWILPGDETGSTVDKINYICLLRTLRTKFFHRKLLISAAVSAAVAKATQSYNIKPMCEVLDFVNLMAYDMYKPDTASIHSPLNWENFDHHASHEIIVNVVKYFERQGCPSPKLILGIPAYGRTFTLKKPNQNNVGANVVGVGPKGPYTGVAGFLGFNEICELQKVQQGWRTKLLQKNAAIYAWRNVLWASYDDPRSIAIKGRYVRENNLGGLMFWSIDTDDFRAICSKVRYPLLLAANKALNLKN